MTGRRRVVEAALGRVGSYREIEIGYDSVVAVVDEEWIFRFPRRPEVERVLESEIALLPELAPTLPVAVPHFEHVLREPPVCVGYRMLRGEPLEGPRDATPESVAAFLSALHGFDTRRAQELGVRAPDWRAQYAEQGDEFRRIVLPALERDERRRAEALFAQVDALEGFLPVVAHVDLGSEHLLCRDGVLAAVIDWGDVHVGDPAIDFSWLLHGLPRAWGDALHGAYDGPADEQLRERALFYHRLAPWYEAHYGLAFDRPLHAEAGLFGIRERLVR